MTLYLLGCGSRGWTDVELLEDTLDRASAGLMFGELKVIHGGARGADTMVGNWAEAKGWPVKSFPADWTLHGRSAGPKRNQRMLDFLVKKVEKQGDGHGFDPDPNDDEFCRHCGHPPADHAQQRDGAEVYAFATPRLVDSKGTKDMVTRARKAQIHVNLIEKEMR